MIIGVANVGTFAQTEVDMVSSVLADELDVVPLRGSLAPLAGPNDLVNIIADGRTWLALGSGALIWLTGKIADDVYDALKARLFAAIGNRRLEAKELKNLPSRLSVVVMRARAKHCPVIVRVVDDQFKPGDRLPMFGSGIELIPTDNDQGIDVAMQIVEFASKYANIQSDPDE